MFVCLSLSFIGVLRHMQRYVTAQMCRGIEEEVVHVRL